MRPVFPEERLLLEIMTDKEPGYYEKMSVWNCSGNRYIADGHKVDFAVKDLKDKFQILIIDILMNLKTDSLRLTEADMNLL